MLHSLYNTNESAPLQNKLHLQTVVTDVICSLCLECNPECSSCADNICVNPMRVCDTCLICSYVLDKYEFSRVFTEYTSNFQNFVSAIHFNARSLSKNLKSISALLSESEINFDLIAITDTKLQVSESSDTIPGNDDNLSVLQIPGFNFQHTPTILSFGGAGLYISQKIHFKRKQDFEFKIDSCETCFVELISQERRKIL